MFGGFVRNAYLCQRKLIVELKQNAYGKSLFQKNIGKKLLSW